MATIKLNLLFAFLMVIPACNCSSDTLPLSDYESVRVGVYFYFPDDTEKYLGSTMGASNCGNIAYRYANEASLSSGDSWSYICCTHENGSDCYRKIRWELTKVVTANISKPIIIVWTKNTPIVFKHHKFHKLNKSAGNSRSNKNRTCMGSEPLWLR